VTLLLILAFTLAQEAVVDALQSGNFNGYAPT